MIEVVEVNEIEALAEYRRAWSGLLSQTPGATFFQSLEWLEAYWRHFGGEQVLRTLIVASDGRPTGIVPLVERTEHTRAGAVRVLGYPLDEWGTFYGPIGPNPTDTLTATMRHLHHPPRDWDVLELRSIDAQGHDGGRTEQAMRIAGLSPVVGHWMTAAQIDLTQGWDAYWASRKSHWRNNVRRSERKLRERGRVRYIRYRPRGRALGDGAPRWDLYNACERLAENSWQATSTSGTTLSHSLVRSFFRDAHARAAEAGTLDLNLLLVDDVPAAFSYNYHYKGQVTGLRMGFDHAVAREGAGVVLQYLTLRDSFERRDRLYDLGTEYLECKRYWQTSHVETQRCTYYAPLSLRGQAMRLRRGIQAWWGNHGSSKSATKAS